MGMKNIKELADDCIEGLDEARKSFAKGKNINFVATHTGTTIRIRGRMANEDDDSDKVGEKIYSAIGNQLARIRKQAGQRIGEISITLLND